VRALVALLALSLGCGKLRGFGGDVPPLATFQLEVTGDLTTVSQPEQPVASLDVALIWGAPWLSELICVLPPESDAMAAVLAAGCRDPFGFVPLLVEAVAPVEPNVPTELSLYTLPSADTLVGALGSRVAYASIIVFDDHDASGTLELGMPHDTPSGEDDRGNVVVDYIATYDLVYGASFNSMTEPDQRLAYREGSFDRAAAFYPRHGCGDPLRGFSIVAAGGFSAADGIAAAMRGELPSEDPATCEEAAPASAAVGVQLRKPDEVRESICTEPYDITARYHKPPAQAPDFTARVVACGHIPDFGDASANMIQAVVSGRSDDPCKSLTHYVLRGCFDGPVCAVPDWDLTANPPSWWPCH
jgi:hypothetical protein